MINSAQAARNVLVTAERSSVPYVFELASRAISDGLRITKAGERARVSAHARSNLATVGTSALDIRSFPLLPRRALDRLDRMGGPVPAQELEFLVLEGVRGKEELLQLFACARRRWRCPSNRCRVGSGPALQIHDHFSLSYPSTSARLQGFR